MEQERTNLERWRRIRDDINGYHPENLALAARREDIARVRSERACKDAGKNLLDQIWVTQTSLWTQLTRNFDRDCAPRSTR